MCDFESGMLLLKIILRLNSHNLELFSYKELGLIDFFLLTSVLPFNMFFFSFKDLLLRNFNLFYLVSRGKRCE